MRSTLAAVIFLGFGVVGCDAGPAGVALGSRQQREERALQLVRDAVSDLSKGATSSARGRIDSAVALRGGDASARTRVAVDLLEAGRPEAAERLLMPSLSDTNPSALPALGWGVLATAAAKQGDSETEQQARTRAVEQARREAERFGTRPSTDIERVRRIRELLDLAKYHSLPPADGRQVIAACREAVAVARQSPIARSRLARALADYGRTNAERDEAVETALEAIQFHREQVGAARDLADLHDAYGWALLRRGQGTDTEAACRVLGDAIEDMPENPDLRLHYGLALAACGKRDAAEVELGRALLLRPDFPEAMAAKQAIEETFRKPNPAR
jgi:Tfp pilus assembly protein PilF